MRQEKQVFMHIIRAGDILALFGIMFFQQEAQSRALPFASEVSEC